MLAIATDVLMQRGLSVCLSVCLSMCTLVTLMSSVKTAEPIKMPFGGRLAWRNLANTIERSVLVGDGGCVATITVVNCITTTSFS